MMEAGVPDFEITTWYGVFAPARVIPPILSVLNAALVQSLAMFGAVLIALPAAVFGALGLFVDPAWHAASFAAGVGLGVLVLALGIGQGGRVFDARGPEMLAAALRA